MWTASQLIRTARAHAGLSQAALADRLGTSQAAVAHLERRASNPTVRTLGRVLRAADHRLELSARPHVSSVDESLLSRRLGMSPAERVRAFEAAYASAREVAEAGVCARGDLA